MFVGRQLRKQGKESILFKRTVASSKLEGFMKVTPKVENVGGSDDRSAKLKHMSRND